METAISQAPINNEQQPIEENVIVIEHLFKKFGDNAVLKDFNLKVQKGENTVVLGKSGSGKSVLIKCIIGLLTPDSGSIKVFGEEMSKLDEEGLDKIRTKIGFLFQGNALYDSMTIRENLEFPVRRHWVDLSEPDINKMVLEALENVGLEKTVDMMPSELSGGMLKRVALARTIILKPEIILYDEPTTGLDPVTSREIENLILTLQKKYQTTTIIISHDMTCVKNVSDVVALLLNGKCYTEGSYESLAKSTDEQIKQFFE